MDHHFYWLLKSSNGRASTFFRLLRSFEYLTLPYLYGGNWSKCIITSNQTFHNQISSPQFSSILCVVCAYCQMKWGCGHHTWVTTHNHPIEVMSNSASSFHFNRCSFPDDNTFHSHCMKIIDWFSFKLVQLKLDWNLMVPPYSNNVGFHLYIHVHCYNIDRSYWGRGKIN